MLLLLAMGTERAEGIPDGLHCVLGKGRDAGRIEGGASVVGGGRGVVVSLPGGSGRDKHRVLGENVKSAFDGSGGGGEDVDCLKDERSLEQKETNWAGEEGERVCVWRLKK